RARGVEHPHSHKAAVQRLVARASARDERDLAVGLRRAAVDDTAVEVDLELRMRGLHPAERFDEHVLRGVDELLHAETSSWTLPAAVRSARVCAMTAKARAASTPPSSSATR